MLAGDTETGKMRRWAARRTAGVAHNRREIVEEAFAGKGKYRSANGGTLD
jgi:hypothetical protein